MWIPLIISGVVGIGMMIFGHKKKDEDGKELFRSGMKVLVITVFILLEMVKGDRDKRGDKIKKR